MPRSTTHPKESSFNLRIDPALKAAFTAAAEAEDRPAAQILRDFMQAYVNRQERRAFIAEAHRQSQRVTERDETDVMAWIESAADTTGWTA